MAVRRAGSKYHFLDSKETSPQSHERANAEKKLN
jgi:hypothetical protein